MITSGAVILLPIWFVSLPTYTTVLRSVSRDYHVVFVTKFRYQCLTAPVLEEIRTLLPTLANRMGVEILEINGEPDHIHFLLRATPQDCLGSLIGALKARSSSLLHQKFSFPYWGKHRRTLWSSGYFVCSVGGAPLDVLKEYIRNQNGA